MPPAARVTDMHVCPMVTGVVPHVGGPILPPCSVNVLIGGLPAARVTDLAFCVGPPDMIIKGSTTVLINNLPAARMGDMTIHGGVIVMGCPTVLIGDGGGGGGGFGGGPSIQFPPANPIELTADLGDISPTLAPSTPVRDGFASRDAAARAALAESLGPSIEANLEYGGLIYRNADGSYGYTAPVQGSETGLSLSGMTVPSGATEQGYYHTHGDYSIIDSSGRIVRTSDPARDSFNSDNFSRADRDVAANRGAGNANYRGYLATPGGVFKSYDPATGNETTL